MHVELSDVAVSTLADDEILVSIEAVGVGVHGRDFSPQVAEFPSVIGIEGAGRMVALPERVTIRARADQATFSGSMNSKGGT